MKIKALWKRFWLWLFGDRITRIAEKNQRNYQNFLAGHAPSYASGRIELKRVYTDIKGNNWYLPKDMLMLIRERQKRVEELHTALDYGMTSDELAGYLGKAIEEMEKMPFEFGNKSALQKNYNNALREMKELQFRATNIKSEDIILEIALMYFFIDNEDPYMLNEVTQQRKKKLTQKDDALRAFFLNTTVLLLKQSIENGNDDTKN